MPMSDAIEVARFSRVSTNGIHLHIAEAGSTDGDLLFLLHGFPEFWYGWRNHIGRFAAAGFRVVVPDQRGYNLSDKPKGIAAYDLDQACADIVGLADGFGRGTFNIIGHDWGAAVGWWTATRHAIASKGSRRSMPRIQRYGPRRCGTIRCSGERAAMCGSLPFRVYRSCCCGRAISGRSREVLK